MVLLGSVSADTIDKADAEVKKGIHFENSLVYGSQFAAEDLPHVGDNEMILLGGRWLIRCPSLVGNERRAYACGDCVSACSR